MFTVDVLTASAARRRAFYHATSRNLWHEVVRIAIGVLRVGDYESFILIGGFRVSDVRAQSWLGQTTVKVHVYGNGQAEAMRYCVWLFTSGFLDYLAKLLFLSATRIVRWIKLGGWPQIWDFSKVLLLWSAYTYTFSGKYLANSEVWPSSNIQDANKRVFGFSTRESNSPRWAFCRARKGGCLNHQRPQHCLLIDEFALFLH